MAADAGELTGSWDGSGVTAIPVRRLVAQDRRARVAHLTAPQVRLLHR